MPPLAGTGRFQKAEPVPSATTPRFTSVPRSSSPLLDQYPQRPQHLLLHPNPPLQFPPIIPMPIRTPSIADTELTPQAKTVHTTVATTLHNNTGRLASNSTPRTAAGTTISPPQMLPQPSLHRPQDMPLHNLPPLLPSRLTMPASLRMRHNSRSPSGLSRTPF